MGVDHCCPQITVAEKLLDGSNIVTQRSHVTRLEQMAGKTVAEGMGGGPSGQLSPVHSRLYRPLHMAGMQMGSAVFPGFRNPGQLFCREKPVSDL